MMQFILGLGGFLLFLTIVLAIGAVVLFVIAKARQGNATAQRVVDVADDFLDTVRDELLELIPLLDQNNLDPLSSLIKAVIDRDRTQVKTRTRDIVAALRNSKTRALLFKPLFEELVDQNLLDAETRAKIEALLFPPAAKESNGENTGGATSAAPAAPAGGSPLG